MVKYVYVAHAEMEERFKSTVIVTATEQAAADWARGAILTLGLYHRAIAAEIPLEEFVSYTVIGPSAVWVKKVELLTGGVVE